MESDKSAHETHVQMRCMNTWLLQLPMAYSPTCVFFLYEAHTVVRWLYQNFKIGNETFTRDYHIRIAAAKHIAGTSRIDIEKKENMFAFIFSRKPLPNIIHTARTNTLSRLSVGEFSYCKIYHIK